MTVGNRDLLAPSIFQLRTCFGIQTVYALAVDEFTALAQIQIDHIGVTATMTLCRGDDHVFKCAYGLKPVRNGALAIILMTRKERWHTV
jgi:hypothetical protein